MNRFNNKNKGHGSKPEQVRDNNPQAWHERGDSVSSAKQLGRPERNNSLSICCLA